MELCVKHSGRREFRLVGMSPFYSGVLSQFLLPLTPECCKNTYGVMETLTNDRVLLEQYKSAIDQSTIVSKTDPYGRIIYANDEFCRLSKYRRDELIGRPHNIVRHPDMPKEAFRDMWATIKSGATWKGIVSNRAKDGSTYVVNATIIPIRDSDQRTIEYIGIRNDITELIKAEERIHKLLSASMRFVPSQFLKALSAEDVTHIQPGDAVLVERAMLFADIRGFTRDAYNTEAKIIFEKLNRYNHFVEPVIREHNGFIDKFIGDGLMAIFEKAEDAVRAGIAIFDAVEKFNAELIAAQKEPIKIGIGIHWGKVALGTVGTLERMDTTVIGDAVNTAARIEALTKNGSVPFLFSGEIASRLPPEITVRRVGTTQLRGRNEKTVLYTAA